MELNCSNEICAESAPPTKVWPHLVWNDRKCNLCVNLLAMTHPGNSDNPTLWPVWEILFHALGSHLRVCFGWFFFIYIYIQSFMRWTDLWVIPAQWDRVSKWWGRQFEALCWLKGTGLFSVLLVVFSHRANANAFQRSMWLKSDLMTSLKVSDGRTCCRSADWCQRSHPLAVYFCQFDLIN